MRTINDLCICPFRDRMVHLCEEGPHAMTSHHSLEWNEAIQWNNLHGVTPRLQNRRTCLYFLTGFMPSACWIEMSIVKVVSIFKIIKMTLRLLCFWYATTILRQHGCRCLDSKEVPNHQHPSCWFYYDKGATWIILHASCNVDIPLRIELTYQLSKFSFSRNFRVLLSWYSFWLLSNHQNWFLCDFV